MILLYVSILTKQSVCTPEYVTGALEDTNYQRNVKKLLNTVLLRLFFFF